MKPFAILSLFVFSLFACSPKKEVKTIAVTQAEDSIQQPLSQALPKLVQLPGDLYQKLDMDEWESLTRWMREFEDFSKLDTKGVELFLNGLDLRTRTFSRSAFPEKLDIFPVRSRLKVVLMQTQKAKFYAKNQQREELIPALDTLYRHYNSFLNRIISVGEEESIEPEELD